MALLTVVAVLFLNIIISSAYILQGLIRMSRVFAINDPMQYFKTMKEEFPNFVHLHSRMMVKKSLRNEEMTYETLSFTLAIEKSLGMMNPKFVTLLKTPDSASPTTTYESTLLALNDLESLKMNILKNSHFETKRSKQIKEFKKKFKNVRDFNRKDKMERTIKVLMKKFNNIINDGLPALEVLLRGVLEICSRVTLLQAAEIEFGELSNIEQSDLTRDGIREDFLRSVSKISATYDNIHKNPLTQIKAAIYNRIQEKQTPDQESLESLRSHLSAGYSQYDFALLAFKGYENNLFTCGNTFMARFATRTEIQKQRKIPSKVDVSALEIYGGGSGTSNDEMETKYHWYNITIITTLRRKSENVKTFGWIKDVLEKVKESGASNPNDLMKFINQTIIDDHCSKLETIQIVDSSVDQWMPRQAGMLQMGKSTVSGYNVYIAA